MAFQDLLLLWRCPLISQYHQFLSAQRKNLLVSIIIAITIIFCCLSGCTTSTAGLNAEKQYSGNTPVSFTDSSNTSFTLSRPAERIVAVNADTIETLIVIGAGEKIVGVPEYVAKNPQFMKHLPNAMNIGDSDSSNIELISSLNPDVIVVMSGMSDSLKTRLKNLNHTVVVFDCYILSDMPSSVSNMGIMTGETEKSDHYLQFFRNYDVLIQHRIKNLTVEQQPVVYLEIGSEYTAAGKGSGGDSIIHNMKGINIARDLPTPWPKVSPEWVVQNNPEVIIKTVHTSVGDEKNLSLINSEITLREGFSGIRAVRNSRVYTTSSNIFYGPKGIIGQLYLGKILYPDRFSDIDPDLILQKYAEEFMTGADTTATVYPSLR
jgi:iron complex transport system substrate-binding protein